MSESAELLPVTSSKPPNPFWRRLYALLSVSLAVFLLSVIATATAFHGFQFGQTTRNAKRHTSSPTANDLETAASEYQYARSATISALANYNAAKARLDEYVSEQLTRAEPEEEESRPTSDDANREMFGPSSAQPTAVADRQFDDRYRELQSQVMAAQQECRAALDRQDEAWRRKVQLASDQAIADRTAAALRAQTPGIGDGPLRATVLWCGLLAITIGVFVCANASVSENVLQSAADVRQQLGLTVLGLLPRGPTRTPHDGPHREPTWVNRCVRSSELCLLALAVGIAILCAFDQKFFTKLLADPVAAVSEQLWC